VSVKVCTLHSEKEIIALFMSSRTGEQLSVKNSAKNKTVYKIHQSEYCSHDDDEID